jgi:uncharacterized membrane protein
LDLKNDLKIRLHSNRSVASEHPSIMSRKRVETLTDGLFAIVLTILVLELTVPVISEGDMEHELLKEVYHMWPIFFSYVTSFILLGFIWMNHNTQFHYIKRVNQGFLWISILYLMVIAMIPFTTSLVGEYAELRMPVLFYGINLTVAMALNLAHWKYATKNSRLVDPDLDPKVVRSISKHIILAMIMYGFATAISLAFPLLSNIVYVVIPALFFTQIKGQVDSLSSVEKEKSMD